MKIGFDLDGTLDHLGVRELLYTLCRAEHDIYVITASFKDAKWQSKQSRIEKLVRLGIPILTINDEKYTLADDSEIGVHLIILSAQPVTPAKDMAYVLRDIGMQKGALIEELGIQIMFDDSHDYILDMKRCCGASLCEVHQ